MRRRIFVVGSLCALAAISCGGGDSQGGSEHEGGYVLLDSDARLAGASLEVGDRAVTSALPIAVSALDRVALVTVGNEVPITVARGELVYVQGASAHVSHLQLGKQIAIDQLRVTGERGAANELALQVGAKVAADQESASDWTLRASDVFAASASANVPEHLASVSPVMLTDVASNAATNPVAIPAAIGASAAHAFTTNAPAVAVAVSEPAAIVPSAASRALFTPAAACSGVGGTWRGRVYSDRHEGYYDFTLDVRQQGASMLKGTVRAEMWSGTTDEIDPPGACAGSRHSTVVESASGRLSADGAMHFDSKSWRVQSDRCGAREHILSYSPDRFEVPRANGATSAHAVVSDDAVWADGLPLEMTRVSCQ